MVVPGRGVPGRLSRLVLCGIGTSLVGAVGCMRLVVDAGASFPNRKAVVPHTRSLVSCF